jgi:hypothetical protein
MVNVSICGSNASCAKGSAGNVKAIMIDIYLVENELRIANLMRI